MKTNIIITIFTLIVFSLSSFGQKVKIKKGIASIDGIPYVKTEKEAGNLSIYGLKSDSELIFIKYYDPTPDNLQNTDWYYIVRFLESKKELEILKSLKGIIKLLYKDKVINENGTINEEKMDVFISKYGSDISGRSPYR